MTISNLEEKTYPTVIVANAAQRIMADQVIAWYGPENIEKVVPSNEIFIEVHFKNGTVRSFFCGMYMPELMERDKDRDRDGRLDAYYRRFFLHGDTDTKDVEEERLTEKEENSEEQEIEDKEPENRKGRSRR